MIWSETLQRRDVEGVYSKERLAQGRGTLPVILAVAGPENKTASQDWEIFIGTEISETGWNRAYLSQMQVRWI